MEATYILYSNFVAPFSPVSQRQAIGCEKFQTNWVISANFRFSAQYFRSEFFFPIFFFGLGGEGGGGGGQLPPLPLRWLRPYVYNIMPARQCWLTCFHSPSRTCGPVSLFFWTEILIIGSSYFKYLTCNKRLYSF